MRPPQPHVAWKGGAGESGRDHTNLCNGEHVNNQRMRFNVCNAGKSTLISSTVMMCDNGHRRLSRWF